MTHEQRPPAIENIRNATTQIVKQLLSGETWWERKRLSLGTGTVNRIRRKFFEDGLELNEGYMKRYTLFKLREASHKFVVVHEALHDTEYTPGMVTTFSWSPGQDALGVSQVFGHRPSDTVVVQQSPEARSQALYEIDKATPQAQWSALAELVGDSKN